MGKCKDLEEYRCKNETCNKLLFRAALLVAPEDDPLIDMYAMEIACRGCKHINRYEEQSLDKYACFRMNCQQRVSPSGPNLKAIGR